MDPIITAEHFTLTPALKDHVERNLEKVNDLLPASASVRVFLSKQGERTFSALYKVHVRGKDLVTEEFDADLYDAISRAANHLKRQLTATRQKAAAARRVS